MSLTTYLNITAETMATGNTKTKKECKKEADYTTDEQEIIRLNTELKDLKDLYDNEAKQNKVLVKESRELTASNLEKQALLDDLNKEKQSEMAEYDEAIEDFNKEIAVLKARVNEKEMTINSFQTILLQAFSK